MSKLLARLSDPARSGVYRVAHELDIRDALSGSAHEIAVVRLETGKETMLAAIARALVFPQWFGGNWDALEDCLTDLSWRKGTGQVILFAQGQEQAQAQAGDDRGILLDVLDSAAEYWRERGRPFFAVFIDPAGQLALPPLYKEKAG